MPTRFCLCVSPSLPAEAGPVAGESMEEAGRLRRLQATYERALIGAAAADGDDKREDSDQGKGLDGGGCRFWGEETMREHGISVLRARGRA